MTITEIIEALNGCEYSQVFKVKLKNGSTERARLWLACGGLARSNKGCRKSGHYVSSWEIADWVSIENISDNNVVTLPTVDKRARKIKKCLEKSGLWQDFLADIDHYLSLGNEERQQLVNDIVSDCYENLWNSNKYPWIKDKLLFESLGSKNCFKKPNYESEWEKLFVLDRVKEVLYGNSKDFSYRWRKGYDNSIEVKKCEDGKLRGWYAEEYKGCGNGHYYLLLDEEHAIFYEND